MALFSMWENNSYNTHCLIWTAWHYLRCLRAQLNFVWIFKVIATDLFWVFIALGSWVELYQRTLCCKPSLWLSMIIICKTLLQDGIKDQGMKDDLKLRMNVKWNMGASQIVCRLYTLHCKLDLLTVLNEKRGLNTYFAISQ